MALLIRAPRRTLDGRDGVVEVVAVEAEARLEAERVARAEAAGLDVGVREEELRDRDRVGRVRDANLEAVLARVAAARHAARVAAHRRVDARHEPARPATLGEDETLGEVRLPVVHAKAGARAAAADGAFLLGYNPGAGRVERIAPARWVALSRSGRDVGELRVRAWLDEEYFHRRRNDAVAAVTATLRDARFAGDAAKVPYRRPSGQEDRRRP